MTHTHYPGGDAEDITVPALCGSKQITAGEAPACHVGTLRSGSLLLSASLRKDITIFGSDYLKLDEPIWLCCSV